MLTIERGHELLDIVIPPRCDPLIVFRALLIVLHLYISPILISLVIAISVPDLDILAFLHIPQQILLYRN